MEPVCELLEQPSHDAATAAEPAIAAAGVDAWSAEGPEISPSLPATIQAGAASSESSATASGQAGPFRQGDPWDRSADRFMARLGLLSEAAPQFGRCDNVLGLGALLAMPALVSSGLFELAAKFYAGRAAAFYGVRSCFACLALMALLRIRRPEQLRHRSPSALGRLLGLDRAPEVKTLRSDSTSSAHRDAASASCRNWCVGGSKPSPRRWGSCTWTGMYGSTTASRLS